MTQLTIMMIRGLSRQQAHWGAFPDRLKQALEEKGVMVTFLFEDLPGFGHRFRQKSPDSIEKIAELLVPTLEKKVQTSKQKVHLLGISMGGMVAAELAKRFPQWCESLVLINTSFSDLSPIYHRMQPSAILSALTSWCHPSRCVSERTILSLSSPRNKKNTDLLNDWLEYRTRFPPSRLAAIKQMIAAYKYRSPRNRPIPHIKIIASKGDSIAHFSCSLRLGNYWNESIDLHPWAGHDLPLEDPDWLIASLVSWYLDLLI